MIARSPMIRHLAPVTTTHSGTASAYGSAYAYGSGGNWASAYGSARGSYSGTSTTYVPMNYSFTVHVYSHRAIFMRDNSALSEKDRRRAAEDDSAASQTVETKGPPNI